jgi:hypothetical protein
MEKMMEEKPFSKMEAVRFGWTTVKTRLGFFVGALMIISLFQVIEYWIDKSAGRRFVIKEDFHHVSDDTEGLYQDLISNGYISQEGEILKKFYRLARYKEMRLSAPHDGQKEAVYRVMFEVMVQVPSAKIPLYVLKLVFWLIGIGIQLGMMKICLKLSRGEHAELNDLFSCYHLLFKYLLSSICFLAIFILGMFLLIIPGIIFGLKYQFYGYLIIDQGAGPIEALKKSSALTRDVKWNLFVFHILLILINFGGVLCLFVGLFVTIPITAVAVAYVYRNLWEQYAAHQGPELITADPAA